MLLLECLHCFIILTSLKKYDAPALFFFDSDLSRSDWSGFRLLAGWFLVVACFFSSFDSELIADVPIQEIGGL